MAKLALIGWFLSYWFILFFGTMFMLFAIDFLANGFKISQDKLSDDAKKGIIAVFFITLIVAAALLLNN